MSFAFSGWTVWQRSQHDDNCWTFEKTKLNQDTGASSRFRDTMCQAIGEVLPEICSIELTQLKMKYQKKNEKAIENSRFPWLMEKLED